MCESRPSPKESKAVFVTIRLIGLPFSFLFPSFDDAFALTLVLRLSSAYSCVITLCKPLSLTPFLLSLTRLMTHLNPRPTHYLPMADIPHTLVTLDPRSTLLLPVQPALKYIPL